MRTAIDVSHWNKIDWSKFSPAFLITKATEATSYIDPTYAKTVSEARKKNIPVGAYHFCRGGDAVKESEYFLKTANDADFYACDWEIQHQDPVGWCKTFCDRLAKDGKPVILYLNESTCNKYDWTPCLAYPLWIAKYGVNDGNPGAEPKTGKWKEWTLWQYTSNGTIAGIGSRVDLNLVKDTFVTSNNEVMVKEFVEAIEDVTGKEYGDNLNEKEQVDAAGRLQDVLEKLAWAGSTEQTNKRLLENNAELTTKLGLVSTEAANLRVALEAEKALNEGNAETAKAWDALIFFVKTVIKSVK